MYYMRAKVPPPLRGLVGKAEIVVSLKTREPSQAVKRVKIESLRADRIIADAEAKLRGQPRGAEVSDDELRWMAAKAFVDLETDSLKRASKLVPTLDRQERREHAETMRDDLCVLIGCDGYPEHDTQSFQRYEAAKIAAKFGIVEGSPLFERAMPFFIAAAIESRSRTVDRAFEKPEQRNGFTELDATSMLPAPPRTSITLGRLLDEFMDYQQSAHAETTPAAYATSVRILREELGNERPLTQIAKQDIERVFALLGRVPVNAAQRYRGMSLEKAIKAADANGDTWRLAPRTLRNYLVHFTAIFNYAIHEGYLRDNPTRSRKLTETVKKAPAAKKRALFTDDQLHALFHAPIYTGCVDDDRRFMVAGPNHPRRGKFWIPLIGLFQGLRCNEACQLHIGDVGTEEGIPFLDIREDSDESARTDKRLKNASSRRRIPIHPELIRIGFMEFVRSRADDSDSPRLFPEITVTSAMRRYSHTFSKWFSRFVDQTCDDATTATFHSFRHHFRTMLMNAGVPVEMAEALGGWSSKHSSSEAEYRHAQLPALLKALRKVRYPKLDLSHLQRPS